MTISPEQRGAPTRRLAPRPSAVVVWERGSTAATRVVTFQESHRNRFPWRRVFTLETALVVGLLVVAGLLHGVNMFHYPYFENDEGTYISQAYSLLYQGQLAPYTYWYDHAPLGWFFIAGWTLLSGGFQSFGSSLYSGRVLMLIIDLANTYFTYRIVRTVTGSRIGGLIAGLVYCSSPYGLLYHRRVLIDNIMTFWMMVSVTFIVGVKKVRLDYVWLSALTLGIAILTKENAVFILPTLPLLVWYRVEKVHRGLAFIGWAIITIFVVSLYPLYAILKTELLPTGTLPWDHARHVSLIGSVLFQGSRGKDLGILDWNSIFWNATRGWVNADPVLVVGGTAAAILSLFFWKTNRLVVILGLGTLFMWAFLARGGVVIEFYLVPLLPLLAMNIGLVCVVIINRLDLPLRKRQLPGFVRGSLLAGALAVVLAAMVAGSFAVAPLRATVYRQEFIDLYTNKQANGQLAAVNWLFQHAAPGSAIIFDDYAYTDLALANRGYQLYWYWKVDLDPAINVGALHDDWNNVDYLLATYQIDSDLRLNHLPLLQAAFDHALPVARFDTGIWPVTIWQVQHRSLTTPPAPTVSAGNARATAPPGATTVAASGAAPGSGLTWRGTGHATTASDGEAASERRDDEKRGM